MGWTLTAPLFDYALLANSRSILRIATFAAYAARPPVRAFAKAALASANNSINTAVLVAAYIRFPFGRVNHIPGPTRYAAVQLTGRCRSRFVASAKLASLNRIVGRLRRGVE
jgi:hypothetical protein